jgi:hypothetical protein
VVIIIGVPYLLLKEEEFKEGCQTTFCRAFSGLSDAIGFVGIGVEVQAIS